MVPVILSLFVLSGCGSSGGQGGPTPQPSASVSAQKIESPIPYTDGSQTMAAQAGDSISSPDIPSGNVIITFNYVRQSGSASNQFAVWIEDMNGQLIKTLYATRFTANGGYKNRPDSIPVWVEKSGLASMTESDIDAVTGATPNAGELSYTWDLTDPNGNKVSAGQYKFFVEGTLRWKNQVLYSGVIDMNNPSTVTAESEFSYEGSGNQPALNDNSPESKMISSVTASFE